jgi:glycine C-acetyltransferase
MIISTAIDIVRDEPARRQQLWENQRYFVARMAELNYRLVATETPIVPIWLGDDDRAEKLAAAIRAEGIHVDAIRFPAVPLNSARLRIQMNAGHRREDIDHLLEVLRRNQHLAEPARRLVAAGAHAGRRPAARAPVVPPASGPMALE